MLITGTAPISATVGGALDDANHFLANAANISVTLPATMPPITATFNDWGVTDIPAIEELLVHQVDDASLAEVVYFDLMATAAPTSVPADGFSAATVSGTLSGLYAPAGNTLAFTTSLGSLWPVTATTDPAAAQAKVTSVHSGTAIVTVTAGHREATTAVTFTPGAVAGFTIDPIGDQVACQAFSITITAVDSLGDPVSSYEGTALITDTTGSLFPTLVGPFDAGTWTGVVLIARAATSDVLTATHPLLPSVTGASVPFTVTHGPALQIGLSPAQATITAGDSLSYTVTATDTCGNAWDATSEATLTIDLAAEGWWAGNVYTSAIAGSWTVTGTMDTLSSTAALAVAPGALARFRFDEIGDQVPGQPFTVTITALDAFTNVVMSYSGTPTLTDTTQTLVPSVTTPFSGGLWTDWVTITAQATDVVITATDGLAAGASNAFDVAYPYRYIMPVMLRQSQ
jgi:hypothetical protein